MGGGSRVEWREWSPQAFEEARRLRRPVLLSLVAGWCQAVRDMDEGAYSDPGCVERIHRDWIPVRVEADRRPDILERFQMGGWPSTVFLLPEGEIVAGATYLDAPDLARALDQVAESLRREPDRLHAEVRAREERIRQVEGVPYPPTETVGSSVFQNTVRGIMATLDAFHGGFGTQPKFPFYASLRVLLAAFAETGGLDFREASTRTLDAMSRRGLCDLRDGGFFRCCSRQGWTHPQTEKLLEDNARAAAVFAAAADLFDRPAYADASAAALSWMRKTLRDPATGAFAAAQSADDAWHAEDADRRGRAAPPVDRTVLVPANALAAEAILRAAALRGDAGSGEEGLRLLKFLLERAWSREEGLAMWLGPDPGTRDVSRPYAVLADALVTGYEYSGDGALLDAARAILSRGDHLFWHEREKGWMDRLPGEGEVAALRLGLRDADVNAVAARAWLRLGILRGDDAARGRAHDILLGFPNYLMDYGHFTAELAVAADLWARPAAVVTVRGDAASPAWRALRDAALRTVAPRVLVRHEAAAGAPTAVVRRGADESSASSPSEVRRLLRGE